VCGPVSSVGIATDYGLDGPGIEFGIGIPKVGSECKRPVQRMTHCLCCERGMF
jgi:hypothetical protein